MEVGVCFLVFINGTMMLLLPTSDDERGLMSNEYHLVEQFGIGLGCFGAIPWKLLSKKPFSI